MHTLKLIVYPFGSAIVAVLLVQLIGMALFGAHLDEWAKWQNQLISVAGTLAGIAGAIFGLFITVREERRSLH